MGYTEFKFLKKVNADKKAREIKQKYGYLPSIFKITNIRRKTSKYVVIKPKWLRKDK